MNINSYYASKKNAIPRITLALIILAILGYITLHKGVTGGFYYDDQQSLGSLEKIRDANDKLAYIFSGFTGPSGRPLALATFTIYAPDWKSQLTTILTHNLALHLVNGVLIFLLALKLFHIKKIKNSILSAFFISALWTTASINVTAVFIPVQRMTLLSHFFVILGCLSFTYGLDGFKQKPRTAIALQLAAFFPLTILAFLSKENGALAPILFFLIERHYFFEKIEKNLASKCRSILYIGSMLIIATTLLSPFIQTHHYEFRHFTLYERLNTQAFILIDYIRLILLPRSSQISPFHDNHDIISLSTSPTLALTSIALVLALIWGSFYFRKKAPLFSFGIGWFFIGHLLESTTLPLELYFEHRNYLPSFGIYLAIVGSLQYTVNQKIWRNSLSAYAILLSIIGYQTATLWGNKALAAEMWSIENPDSYRATINLAILYQSQGANTQVIQKLLLDSAEHCQTCIAPLAQAAYVSCESKYIDNASQIFERIKERLNDPRVEPATPSHLHRIFLSVIEDRCKELDLMQLEDMNISLIERTRFTNWGAPGGLLHYNLYRIYKHSGDDLRSLKYLRNAYDLDPSRDYAGLLMEELYLMSHRAEAHAVLEDFCRRRTAGDLLLSYIARDDCSYLRHWMSNLENGVRTDAIRKSIDNSHSPS